MKLRTNAEVLCVFCFFLKALIQVQTRPPWSWRSALLSLEYWF